MLNSKIGFVGGGQMARALAHGFVCAELVHDGQIVVYDPSSSAVEQFIEEAPGAQVAANNASVVADAGIVFLAVKPQHMPQAATEIRAAVTNDKLIISIAAGISLSWLSKQLKTERIVRVMPNTPCLIGKGAAGFALGSGTNEDDAKIVQRLLSAVGVAFELDESLLDAVTGLSGSGPAYVFTVIEALSDGGVLMGLPRATATALATQTVLGAAAMLQSSGEHPAVLRDRVASPGGTTIAGLQELEESGLRAALIAAVEAATQRSIELGS